jgi:UDP-N-acetylglucosamine 2-epimerase (non-hydrolysing)
MFCIASIVGTRPEAIKMAPVIKALGEAAWCQSRVIATAQHRELLDQVFRLFDIGVDVDLNVMQDAQSLSGLTARLYEGLDRAYSHIGPDFVLAQGDTTTVKVAAMVAFYRGIPFGHVEAGLRSGDLSNPFPEELNRIVASRVASLHFAPTTGAREALLREGIADKSIHVTGNTVIDALLDVASRPLAAPLHLPGGHRVLLLTTHRRENFGAPMGRIFRAIRRLVNCHPDVSVVYPVHPNPHVAMMAREMLGGLDRVHLIAPLDYAALVWVLKRCKLVLTDSGGLQEEAPALGKPVLVMRDETERPEAIQLGVARLVGTCEEEILYHASRLLDDEVAYRAMARAVSPYGDGAAASRIVNVLAERCCPGAPLDARPLEDAMPLVTEARASLAADQNRVGWAG